MQITYQQEQQKLHAVFAQASKTHSTKLKKTQENRNRKVEVHYDNENIQLGTDLQTAK